MLFSIGKEQTKTATELAYAEATTGRTLSGNFRMRADSMTDNRAMRGVKEKLLKERDMMSKFKEDGILLCGLDNGINFIFDDTETEVKYKLPFNSLNNPQQYEESIKNDWGIQFSHTLEEQIGGQIEAGFILTNLYEDTNGEGKLHEYNIPSFVATRAIKP